ncbi:tryptase-2 [Fundulus heteroclitus]|uniref:tryptase-2 n=1 Tax=Fundulus heteroclitus TaxID=8078 RepID=UPI00165B8B81|nr:tryptase-2 [Fundulus heteroclitus]
MAVGELIAALVLLQSSAGSMGAAVGSSIIGGEEAPEGKWPWLVYLDIVTDSGKRKWHCSGTILNEMWVLTAGRCWDDELWSRWDRTGVWIGTHDLDMPSKRYMNVDRIQRSGDFKPEGKGFVNDIALIKLNKTLNFFKEGAKVKLPTDDDTFDASSECWIAGWGGDSKSEPTTARVLQQAKISILPQEKCNSLFPNTMEQRNVMCAGDAKGQKSACDGDYGDPLMCRRGNDFVQVGIMSFGTPDGCNKPDGPSIYTRVSSYMGFIKAYINIR